MHRAHRLFRPTRAPPRPHRCHQSSLPLLRASHSPRSHRAFSSSSDDKSQRSRADTRRSIMPSASIATPEFLAHLKALYPVPPQSAPSFSPWYMIAAIAFSASNRPEEVAALFTHLLSLPEFSQHDQRIAAARKIREGVFKSGLTSGYSRVINALISLHEVTPTDLQETQLMRNLQSLETYSTLGTSFFQSIYGSTSTPVQSLLDKIYPDMGWFSNTIGYGLVYNPNTPGPHSSLHVLSEVEVSYMLVTTLISMDTARQAAWHLDGARRKGASIDQVKAVREIAIEVAGKCGVTWREGVPEVTTGPLE